jgi:hypothetical protein
MYSFWKRTVPPPSLSTFDAPDREKCVARRAVTNTPLQALVLMNDPTYVEAARQLAARALTQAAKARQRIETMFREAALRRPSPGETAILEKLLVSQLASYRGDEQAAYSNVAGVILSMDEVITKE